MPKYILGTDGKVKNYDGSAGSKSSEAESVAEEVAKIGSSMFPENSNSSIAQIEIKDAIQTLAGFDANISNFEVSNSDTHIIKEENVDLQGKHPSNVFAKNGGLNSLANPSFGVEHTLNYNNTISVDPDKNKIRSYRNFNNYLTKNEIFATELEMVAGVELNSFGVKDYGTRILTFLEYIIEVSVYIIAIEGIIAVERLVEDKLPVDKSYNDVEEGFQMQMGTYGEVSYTAITKYIKDVLQYPLDKVFNRDRLTAFFIGTSLFINSDPLSKDLTSYLSNLASEKTVKGNYVLESILSYIIDTTLNLSSVGINRLHMIVRRMNQKSEWVQNRLYKAKDTSLTRENDVEQFFSELSHYYLKFAIERMHVGLKWIKKRQRKSISKLNRSGRIKDAIANNDFKIINAINGSITLIDNTKKKGITNEFARKNTQSISNALLPQGFLRPVTSAHKDAAAIDFFSNAAIESYFIERKDKNQRRLSKESVKALEGEYEKEIVPFYFQDLRTNEIIGFHAFIDSITDTFTPSYNPTKGYGRIDEIKHYTDTNRNIAVNFTLAAMNETDHDLMWYQINKLVSMVYPQWSAGFKIAGSVNKGKEYPFTQVPTASPLIRLRLGDILKSNYTRQSIDMLHGGNNNKVTDVMNRHQMTAYYVRPGVYKTDKNELVYFDKSEHISAICNTIFGFTTGEDSLKDDPKGTKSSAKKEFEKDLKSSKQIEFLVRASAYKVYVTQKNIIQSEGDFKSIAQTPGDFKNIYQIKGDFKSFTNAFSGGGNEINNPITAAYDSTFGKGLAGFITSLDFNQQDQLWETERVGSKAPKAVKISMGFAPIHDIAPGLDVNGDMRAPVYNTGDLIRRYYGEAYDD